MCGYRLIQFFFLINLFGMVVSLFVKYIGVSLSMQRLNLKIVMLLRNIEAKHCAYLLKLSSVSFASSAGNN